MRSALDRKALEWLREDYDVVQGRFSPDGRFLAFLSNEADGEKMQVVVRPFDANKPDAPGPGPAVQVSKDGALGMIFWRQDGKEMYFLNRDWEVMAVDITTHSDLPGRDAEAAVQAAGSDARKPGAVEERQPGRRALHLRHADGQIEKVQRSKFKGQSKVRSLKFKV